MKAATHTSKLRPLAWSTALALLPGAAALAQTPASETQRIEELERRLEILAQEVETARREATVAEEHDYKPIHGVGPAASKIYGRDKGLSIGGYGEGYYKNSSVDGDDSSDFYRQILYFGYRFSEDILLNVELEWEHGDTAVVEFAYLDFLLSDAANIRAGMMLTPLGFINEVHEPSYYFGNIRPTVERQLIPTTSRENGVGLWGDLGENLEYRLYVHNSWDAKGLSGANVRGVRQKGQQALAEDLALTGRLDWTPTPGALIGASFWTGDMGQGQDFAGQQVDAGMTLWDVHAEWKRSGWWLRGLYAQAEIDDTLAISQDAGEAIGERMSGWYAEVGYDVFRLLDNAPANQSLYPWVRYSELDTQDRIDPAVEAAGFSKDPKNDRTVWEAGLHYMPHPNVVVKAEYRDWSSGATAEADNNQEEFLVGIGYNF